MLSKQLYRAIMGCIQWYSTGGEVDMRSRMCHGGWEVWVLGGTQLLYVMSMIP